MKQNRKQQPQKRTLIGGQALIEGVMMRGPERVATVVRKPNGELIDKIDSLPPRGRLAKAPFFRGVLSFWDSLKLGISCLMFSADQSMIDETADSQDDGGAKKESGGLGPVLMTFTVILGVAMPVGLFILLPAFLSSLIGLGDGSRLAAWRPLFESGLRMLIFIGFLGSTSIMKDMRRVYAYHGAEHKTIHCYESGEALTLDNVRGHTRMHPRCGTSFLFVVMIISIFFFSAFWWVETLSFSFAVRLLIKMGLRLALLPLVVAISYEFNRLVGRYDNWLTIALRSPGVALQSLTTREPDDSMIEVAIDALSRVIPEDDSDRW